MTRAVALRSGRPVLADLDRVPGESAAADPVPLTLVGAEVMPKDRQAAQGQVGLALPEDLVLGSSAVGRDGDGAAWYVRGAIDAAGGLRDGLLADRFVAERSWLLALPSGVDPLQVVAGVAPLMDAQHAFDLARLQPGETVLVLGASSGVGAAAVALALHLGHAVIAATRSPAGISAADGLTVIDAADLPAAAREATGGRGVDVVIDTVGGPQTRAAIMAGALRARQVLLGYLAGREPVGFTVTDLMIREHALIGMNAHLVAADRQRELAAAAIDLIAAGVYRPSYRQVPLAAAPAELLNTDPGHDRAVVVP
jgi:NADPH2:quinone reductase